MSVNKVEHPLLPITHPTEQEVRENGYKNWPTWSGEPKDYPASYSSDEVCYFVEGLVDVYIENGPIITIKAGDLVVFKKGLICTWRVKKFVKKHYSFR